nr:carbohydrate kinase [Planctomycetales bacterium]
MSDRPALVIGDVCVDLVVQIPQQGGSDRQHPPPELYGGGTGGNTAVALARLDVPTAFMGTVGDDGYGRFAV